MKYPQDCIARSACFRLLVCATLLVAASGANAQTYPTRALKVVNPWPAGGPADVLARPVMIKLSERLGQPVVFENKPGAAGVMGSDFVAKATPDGYTLLIGNVTPISINPAMRSDMPYNTARDFEPVTQMVSAALVLVVRPDLPAKTLQELIAYAKARPGKLTFGSAGAGSITHLAGAMLLAKAGIDALHVPYQGQAPTITALMAGQIDMGFLNISGLPPYLKSGQLRGLAVTTPKRSELFPELPAVAEMFPGFEASSWYGVVAPKGTPKDIIARLHREIVAIFEQPDIIQSVKNGGLVIEASSPEQFRAKLTEDLARWAEVVKVAGLAPK